jgi:hypothetical protein
MTLIFAIELDKDPSSLDRGVFNSTDLCHCPIPYILELHISLNLRRVAQLSDSTVSRQAGSLAEGALGALEDLHPCRGLGPVAALAPYSWPAPDPHSTVQQAALLPAQANTGCSGGGGGDWSDAIRVRTFTLGQAAACRGGPQGLKYSNFCLCNSTPSPNRGGSVGGNALGSNKKM